MAPGSPAPAFPTAAELAALGDAMRADPEWADQFEWSETIVRPANPEDMALELCWVILNSGMKASVAKKIWPRMRSMLIFRGRLTKEEFGHEGKLGAMNSIYRDRAPLYRNMMRVGDADLADWCQTLPWIGGITKFHAAKNLGADVVKPDRWIARLAARAKTTPEDLLRAPSAELGWRLATADLVVWWGCAFGRIDLPSDDAARPQLRLPASGAAS
ncbi:MAG: hypothetical protein IBJ15_00330 [Alphaproteobacteria bacterium]|nr:hypothetical protein [Alphaproteobacteria bacterium]